MQSLSAQFHKIDWDRPWFLPFSSVGKLLANTTNWRAEANKHAARQTLLNHRGLPIVFIPQESLSSRVQYESQISMTGEVPSRDNLHDFFNALIWLTFPKTKARLNELQAHCLSIQPLRHDKFGRRGPIRDAATVFDENAALLITSDNSLIASLREHEWLSLFQERRGEFERNCEVLIFGHALLEKLTSPYKAVTAHVWPIKISSQARPQPLGERISFADSHLSDALSSSITTKSFLHLPILGVPNWWDQQDSNFYADTSVFRPKKLVAALGSVHIEPHRAS